MEGLRITSMRNVHEAVEALCSGAWDVVVTPSEDFEGEPTCHILFSSEMEDAVVPALPEVEPKDPLEGFQRVTHCGHTPVQVVQHFNGYPLDLQDQILEAWLEGTTQEIYGEQCCAPEGRRLVQFVPCGHTGWLQPEEVKRLAGNQLRDIAAGVKIDAPSIHSDHCERCKIETEDAERRFRQTAWLAGDFGALDW